MLQRMALDFVLDILYFPLWWYSSGAKRTLLGCFHQIQAINQNLAPGLWLRNIFVPMFGQYDWQGRIMSFFMRLVNVIARTIALGVSIIFVISFFFLWLAFPPFVIYMLVASLFP